MGDVGVGGKILHRVLKKCDMRIVLTGFSWPHFSLHWPLFNGNGLWSFVTRKEFLDHMVATVNFLTIWLPMSIS